MQDDTNNFNTIDVEVMAKSGITIIPDFRAIELAILDRSKERVTNFYLDCEVEKK